MSDKPKNPAPNERSSQNQQTANPVASNAASELKKAWSQPESPQSRLAMDHKPKKK